MLHAMMLAVVSGMINQTRQRGVGTVGVNKDPILWCETWERGSGMTQRDGAQGGELDAAAVVQRNRHSFGATGRNNVHKSANSGNINNTLSNHDDDNKTVNNHRNKKRQPHLRRH